MKEQYIVYLTSNDAIDIPKLASRFTWRDLYPIFMPQELTPPFPRDFFCVTTSCGDELLFNEHDLSYSFGPSLEEQQIRKAIKSAIQIATKLKVVPISFNPNFLGFYLGWFSSDETFEQNVGQIARNLQNTLYGGGIVAYDGTGGSYGLFLGTEREVDQFGPGFKTDRKRFKKLHFEGTAHPAQSLDELLKRIEQSKS